MIFLIACIPFVLIFVVQLTSVIIQETQYIAVENVFFDTSEMVIEKLDYKDVSIQFPAKINPIGANNQDIIYSSSNDDIAIVDNFGNITFKDFGFVTIYAQSKDNMALVAECRFHVTDTKAHRVEIVEKPETMVVNETYFVCANIIPIEAVDKSLTYYSSNPEVAEIMPDGMIQALSGGNTIITVETANGCADSFELEIVVPAKGIEILETRIITAETNIEFPNYTIFPENASNKDVRFISGNEAVAIIDENGMISFKQAGTVNFTIETIDGGFCGVCEITSTNGYILYGNLLTSNLNVNYELNREIPVEVEVYPSNANLNNVYFISNDTDVVSVNQDGKLVIVGGRNAKVDVYIRISETESNKIGTLNIFVDRPIEEINIATGDKIETNLREYQIKYSVEPANDYTDSISFVIDSNVAEITQSGLVIFSSPGNAIIDLISDGGIKESVEVTYVPSGAKQLIVNSNLFTTSVNYLDSMFAIVFDNSLDMVDVGYDINQADVVEYNSSDQVFNILKGGDVVITATSANGNIVTINIQVIRLATSLNATIDGFGDSVDILTANNSLKVIYNVLPLDATNRDVQFKLNDGAKASVNDAGVITFSNISEKIVLSVTAVGGTDLIKTFNIEYTNGLPIGFVLNDVSIEIEEVGSTYNISNILFKSFEPMDYEFNMEDFSFESLNQNIVVVTNEGVIQATGGGHTNLKIVVKNSSYSEVVPVEVVIKCTGVDFIYNSQVFNGGKIIGDKFQLDSIVYPNTATNKNVLYEIVSGKATINSNGLVTFIDDGEVTIRVSTNNNIGKVIILEKVSGPTQLRVLKGNVDFSNDIVNVNLIDTGNVVLKIEIDGIVDTQNIDYSNIKIAYDCEEGLVLNVENNGNGYYTIGKTISIAKSLKSNITFSYGTTSVETTIKYCQLTSLKMTLDSNVLYSNSSIRLDLDNQLDKNYGLERKLVFGVKSYYNSALINNIPLMALKNKEAELDTIYWFSDNTQIAYFENVTSGVVVLNTGNVTNETTVDIFACSEPTMSVDNAIIYKYTMTFIPNAVNVYDIDGYKYVISNRLDCVLHTNIGSVTDENAILENTPYIPFSALDPVTDNVNSDDLNQIYIRSNIYGNGYVLNYNGYTSKWNGQIIFYKNVNNLTLKCQDFDQTKESYTNEASIAGVTVSYTTIQNAKRGLYILKSTSNNNTLKNCIIKHILQYGILISDYTDITLYMENMLIYDCGQTAVNLQKGVIKIKGFFNVVNFRSPSEFDTFGYEDILKKAYSSSAFSDYVDKGDGDSANYKINLAIVATPKNLVGSPDSTASTVYFWDEEKNDYVGNEDNCTGLNYDKLSYTNGKIIKTTIYVWTTKLINVPIDAKIDESIVYRKI